MSTLAVLLLPLFIIFLIAMGLIFCGLQQKSAERAFRSHRMIADNFLIPMYTKFP